MSEHPVSVYAVEYGIKHTAINNAIRDYLKGKPWGLKAQKVPMTPVYIIEQSDFDAWYQRYQANRRKRGNHMQTLQTATRDGIITAIHILWERGWQVNPESVREMLRLGCKNDSSLERIEAVMSEVVSQEAKERWLGTFNPESAWNKAHPRWDIPNHWVHQQIENSI